MKNKCLYEHNSTKNINHNIKSPSSHILNNKLIKQIKSNVK